MCRLFYSRNQERSKFGILIESQRIKKAQEAAAEPIEKRNGNFKRCLGQGLHSLQLGCQANIQRRVQSIMQPMITVTKVRELNDQLQVNQSTPREADAGGLRAERMIEFIFSSILPLFSK